MARQTATKASNGTIRLPYPHPGQQAVLRNQARHHWLCAGRRWRKTTLAMSIAVQGALQGREWIWGAPTSKQLRICWRETERAAGDVAEFLKSELTVKFPTGGKIYFFSMDDPDNARGPTADGVVLDEAPLLAPEAWYDVLRPTLLDTGGVSWCIGTPKGQNWFWRECVAAADREDSRFWNAPTLGCAITERGLERVRHPLENPEIPFEELQQLYRTLPERVFRQEILAEFSENASSVFRKVREAVDAGRTANEPAQAGHRYLFGCDLARVEDFTVITALDRHTRRQVYHERFNQISWERQIESIARASRAYGNAAVALDTTGVGDMPWEALRKAGVPVLPFKFTNAAKENLIDGLAMALEGGELRLMDLPAQTAELLAFQYELTPSRNVRMGAPEGMHDDTVIALALARWACAQPVAGAAQVGGQRTLATRYQQEVGRYAGGR